jgi:hypothetical protein
MRSLHVRAHVDKQGQVTFKMRPELANQDVDLVVVFEPIKSTETGALQTASQGWPTDFFEEVAGSLPDFPEIEPEGDFEVREPLG